MFDVMGVTTWTFPLYIWYAGSEQHTPLFHPPVKQSPNTLILTNKLSGVHVWSTVTLNLIVNGPVDIVPQSGLNQLEFTNLQPGPKFNPLGNVFCKSHNQYPDWVPFHVGAINGCNPDQPGPKFIWNAIIQFIFNWKKYPSV